MMLPSLLVVDRDVAFSAGLLLDFHAEGYRVVGTTTDAEVGVLLASVFRPHLIILETPPGRRSLPGLVEKFREASPSSRILLHDRRPNEELLAWVLAAGVAGIVCRHPGTSPLLVAVRQVFADGTFYLQPGLTAESLTAAGL